MLLVCGLPVGIAVRGTFEDLRGWPDFRFWRLQDRVSGEPRPGRESLAEVAVIGVLGGDGQVLQVREPLGERAVRGCQVLNPLAHFRGRFPRGQGELGALAVGGGFGFSGAERG